MGTGSRNLACLTDAQVERLAAGDPTLAEVAAHADTCSECKARLGAAREDAKFLGRFRTLTADARPPMDAPRIPGYRVQGQVGVGSQGVVFRGVQAATNRDVAIKVLAAGDAATARQRSRAEREVEIAARLRHPNIVTVYESRTLSDGRIAVVMEFIDGVAIDAWQPQAANGAALASAARQESILRGFLAVCAAIHHAHLQGVIHRDLKPDNILVTKDARPVVLDFGIAKATGRGGLHTTLTGEFAGTPAYASPEQVSGHPDQVDALSDVYALGVILYKLLAGVLPYDVEGTMLEVVKTITHTPPKPLREVDPSIPPDLEAIVQRALRKDKEWRYQSAASLARDLERYLAGEPVDARSGSGWYLLQKAVSVNRWRFVWAGAALIALSAAIGSVAMSGARARASAQREQQQRDQARVDSVRARAVTELLRETLPSSDPAHPEIAAAVGSGLGKLYYKLETGGFSSDPELDLSIRRLWGEVYTGFSGGKASGRIEHAEYSLRNGLVRLRMQHQGDHAEIAATLHELAGVLLVRKRLTEAEQFCRDALAMRERLSTPRGIDVANTRALLARILSLQGKHAEADRAALLALDTFRQQPGDASDVGISSMLALRAEQRLAAGNAGEEVEAMVREALVHRLRWLPADDPDTLASLRDVAKYFELAGQSQKPSVLAREVASAWQLPSDAAYQVLRDALLLDITILSTPDPSTYSRYVASGRTRAMQRILRMQEALLGPHDPAILGTLVSVMRFAESEGLYQDRCDASLRIVDEVTRRQGVTDFGVLACVYEAAHALSLSGKPLEGAAMLERADLIWQAVPEPARDRVMQANGTRLRAWYLSMGGKQLEAQELYQQAITQLRAVVGEEHHLIASALAGLAYCKLQLGEAAPAEELSMQALAMALRMPATSADQLAHIRFARAQVEIAQGKWSQAREQLTESWTLYYYIAPPTFPWYQQTLESLVRCCEELGDPVCAAKWRSERSLVPIAPPSRAR